MTSLAGQPSLIEDLTPAGKGSPAMVAQYELQNSPKGREVFLRRGTLFFSTPRDVALKTFGSKVDRNTAAQPTSLDSME